MRVKGGRREAHGGTDEANLPNVQVLTPEPPLFNLSQPLSPDPSPLPTQREFTPTQQVDHFTWPKVCRRLIARAAEELDRLADALLAANTQGQKVLAITGCRRGEGATTLLLCAARRLAERGVKPVLVDADLARPQLAKRLGVEPQFGWDETSDEKGKTLDRAIVEATANNVALVPAREPPTGSGGPTGDTSRLAACINVLRSHYDMVLVDLGPLENIESIGEALTCTVEGKIDAVLLVHNRRITSAERLGQFEQELTSAGVVLAGMIENFVAS
jgi:Mrp family chromosome partitioning ATPase